MTDTIRLDWNLAPHETLEAQTRYHLIDDATGVVLKTAPDPVDLFDADELRDDESLQQAVRSVIEHGGEALIGGGASPLFRLVDSQS